MTHHKKITIVVVIVLLLLVFFLRPKPQPAVETQKVTEGDVTQVLSATGKVESENSADLTFLTAGKLVYLGVKEGDTVKKGQVIATLDQRTVQKNLESSLRDYAKARNTFEQTKDTNGNATPDTAANEAVKRVLEDSQYDLDKAVISVELQTLAQEQSVLTSPIDGVVTRADAKSAGVNVAPTTTFTIDDPYNLVFKIDVDESDIGKVRLQQPINITLDAFPDRKITVPVDSIDFASHKTDTGGNAYTVTALLPENNNFEYRVGMNGDAEIVLRELKHVLHVPLASISDNDYVYVKKDKGFEKRKIEKGLESDTDVEVKSGLTAGDEIAVDPTTVAKK